MNNHELFSVTCALSVILGIFCEKKFKLQPTISLLIISFFVALTCKFSSLNQFSSVQQMTRDIQRIDFSEIFMSYMLGLMLYAGAIHIKTSDFIQKRWEISVLALSATLLSILVIGHLTYGLSLWLNYPLDWFDCMLFGAIISPTDPIAVLGLMKEIKAPTELSTIIAGESLFNDGVGIVAFTVLLETKAGLISLSLLNFLKYFMFMSLGGIAMGLLVSFVSHWLFERLSFSINQKIMITIAQVVGGYELCEAIHVSGALFAVVLGLANGYMLTKREESSVMRFWDIIDEFLNLVLFLLIGFEVISLSYTSADLVFAMWSIVGVILVRFIMVNANIHLLHLFQSQPKHIGHVISWSGLRGGLAVALALSVPSLDVADNKILLITYTVVLFSVIVQGISSKKVLKWYMKRKR